MNLVRPDNYLGHSRKVVAENEFAREVGDALDDRAPVRRVVQRWAEVHLERGVSL